MLVFFAGASAIPPLGFDVQPKVSFLHSPCGRFCKASTCDLHLKLPTRYGKDYCLFKEAMCMSLIDNDGFGGI